MVDLNFVRIWGLQSGRQQVESFQMDIYIYISTKFDAFESNSETKSFRIRFESDVSDATCNPVYKFLVYISRFQLSQIDSQHFSIYNFIKIFPLILQNNTLPRYYKIIPCTYSNSWFKLDQQNWIQGVKLAP